MLTQAAEPLEPGQVQAPAGPQFRRALTPGPPIVKSPRIRKTCAKRVEEELEGERPYIRNTPKVVSGIGALRAAEIPSAITLRVSTGSMIPSSQSRAVE
jgi:hypothetical protein